MEVKISQWAKKAIRWGMLWGGAYGAYWGWMRKLAEDNQKEAREKEEGGEMKVAPGDLVFVKYDCGKLLTRNEIETCYTEHIYKSLVFFNHRENRYRQGEWDSLFISAIDSSNRPRLLGFSNGAYRDYAAESFQRMPFIVSTGIRHVISTETNIAARSLNFKHSLENIYRSLSEGWSIFPPEMFRDEVDLVLNCLVQIGVADTSAMKTMLKITIEDMNVRMPKVLGVGVAEYSELERWERDNTPTDSSGKDSKTQ